MAQEQQTAQDVPVEKAAAGGSLPDVLDNMLKQVNEIRSSEAPDASALAENLVSGSRASGLQTLKELGLDKLSIGGAAHGVEFSKDEPARKNVRDPKAAEGHGGVAEGFSRKTVEKAGKVPDASDLKDVGNVKYLKQTERQLSRIEQVITKELLQSARSCDMEGMKEMLATLSESPKSIDAVMHQVRASLSREGSRANVGWERGTDDSGNSFVRMHLTTYDKVLGLFTRVTVGSDGTQNAYQQSDKPGSQRESIDAKEAMGTMLKPLLDAYRKLQRLKEASGLINEAGIQPKH